MSYTVHLRRVSDGVVRRIPMMRDWHTSGWWFWSGGMMGCDCWRALEFERAGGNLRAGRAGCSRGAFVIDRITDRHGAVIHEGEPDGEHEGEDGVGYAFSREELGRLGRRARSAKG